MKKINLCVEGMVCEGCENRVKNSLSLLEEVESVEANHKNNSVSLSVSDNVDIDEIKTRINDLGFTVSEDKDE